MSTPPNVSGMGEATWKALVTTTGMNSEIISLTTANSTIARLRSLASIRLGAQRIIDFCDVAAKAHGLLDEDEPK